MAENRHRAEVEITIAGKTETLRGTFDAMARIESGTGVGCVALLSRYIAGNVGFHDTAVIITEGLRAGSVGEQAKLSVVGELIFDEGLLEVGKVASKFLAQAIGADKSEGNRQAAKRKIS